MAAADAYSYLHLVLVAGIIVFAVGARSAVADANHALPIAPRLALSGGVAFYLAGQWGFWWRMVGRFRRPLLIAVAATVLAFALSGGLPAWATAAAPPVVLAGLVAWDRYRLDR
ncbi:MAG: low temperature requirement protein A [Chloroflexota bacterium]